MKIPTTQIKRYLTALIAVSLLVGVGLWTFDGHAAQGREVPADALVVDVRTPGEYARGHYEGAINIPVSQIAGRTAELGHKDRHIIVYCRSGNRSAVAKRILARAGFTNVEDGGGLGEMRRRNRAAKPAAPRGEARPAGARVD